MFSFLCFFFFFKYKYLRLMVFYIKMLFFAIITVIDTKQKHCNRLWIVLTPSLAKKSVVSFLCMPSYWRIRDFLKGHSHEVIPINLKPPGHSFQTIIFVFLFYILLRWYCVCALGLCKCCLCFQVMAFYCFFVLLHLLLLEWHISFTCMNLLLSS